MALSLIATLNNLQAHTPDEIIAKLRPNPWVQLGHSYLEGFRDSNHNLEIYLFNTQRQYYWDFHGNQPRTLEEAGTRAMSLWGRSVLTTPSNRHWFFAPASTAIPFLMGIHDVTHRPA